MEKEVWPIYKKDLLILSNLNSSTGICTLWTEKEKIIDKISNKNYIIAGQCYSTEEGINLIIRNILANKKLHRIVLCGTDLSHSGDVLIALKKNGINDEREIIGTATKTKIEPEIPLGSIDNFRKNIEIIDKRDLKDYNKLNEFLESLENKEPWGEAEIYERKAPIKPEFYSSENTGIVVRGKKVGDVWLKILDTILRFGYKKKSQYSDEQLEIIGLISVITDEDPKNIDWKEYFQFTEEHFKNYLPQLMSSEIISDVNYTYGSKLRNFKGFNQIESIINQLKETLFTRRAIAVTFDVEKDLNNPHSPCLDLIQALVQDKLYLTAYFRSNDMFAAWPENALALRTMQYEIAERIGVIPGDLIIVSNSAHIYSSNWEEAKKILKNYPIKIGGEPDPRGNIVIETENGKIKITHLSPDGKRIGEFSCNRAFEAYREIEKRKIISQIGHALDIGVELGKAEIALKEGRKYIQDKDLK